MDECLFNSIYVVVQWKTRTWQWQILLLLLSIACVRIVRTINSNIHGDKMNLLVVDDEKEILTLIKKALSGQYQVDTVHFPIEKIPEDLSGHSLILMDVMMPNENGYTIVEKIRNKVDCPIIFLSAKALEDDIIYGLAIGADDYICKPFSIGELRARVSAHIRRENRSAVGNIIRKGDVSVNLTEKRISVKEKDIVGDRI